MIVICDNHKNCTYLDFCHHKAQHEKEQFCLCSNCAYATGLTHNKSICISIKEQRKEKLKTLNERNL